MINTAPNPDNLPIKVCALYKFKTLDELSAKREEIVAAFVKYSIKGSLLISEEGINGTISGQAESLENAIAMIANVTGINDIPRKYSWAQKHPFHRSKVRIKKEIVTIGSNDVNPNKIVGTYVAPKDWNAIISDPEMLVLDTRNDYEVEIGSFKNAVDPKTESFRDFPKFVRENYDAKVHKKVAMFCTGGIRCEKASAFMLMEGFETVYHLDGGILNYLDKVPPEESLWQGDCFVFDDRVAVGHGVTLTDYVLCHGCRAPLNAEQQSSPLYAKGVSCPKCANIQSEQNRNRASERQKQMELAKARGIVHLGQKQTKKA